LAKLNYKLGTWFAIPLQNAGFAIGRVARHAPKGGIVLAYLFGPRRETIPYLQEIERLNPQDAIKVWMIGDLGILSGIWPVIGDSSMWTPEQWPTPNFIRKVDLGRQAWRVIYSDDNPNQVLSEERIPYDTPGLERDSLFGHKAAEFALSHLLS
jgi:hypothetical protein